MSLGFAIQQCAFVRGTSPSAGVTLTAADVASTAISIDGMSQSVVVVYYTPKTGQSNRNLYVLPQFSHDGGTTWESYSKGVDATAASAEIATTVYGNRFTIPGAAGGTQYCYRIPISVGETGYETTSAKNQAKMRVLCKEDGSADFGVAAIAISVSGK